MASKKDIWLTIEQEYITADSTISQKELAQKYGVSYNTLRHKAANWNKKKQIIKTAEALTPKKHKNKKTTKKDTIPDTLPCDLPEIPSGYSYEVPENKDLMHMEMYDKLAVAVLKYLDNPDFYFETENGFLKSKIVTDIANTIRTIQQGQNEAQDRLDEKSALNKETKLDKYAQAIAALRQQKVIKVEEPEKTTSQNQTGEHLEGEDV